MPVTDQDARALTYLACRIRKETHGARAWDEAGTYSVVAELIGHSLASTTERVIRHAADPEAKTPGAIKRPFIPPPAKGETTARFPAKPGEDCRIHKGEWADTCRSCAADRLAGDTPRTPPLKSVPPPVTYLDARRGREIEGASE